MRKDLVCKGEIYILSSYISDVDQHSLIQALLTSNYRGDWKYAKRPGVKEVSSNSSGSFDSKLTSRSLFCDFSGNVEKILWVGVVHCTAIGFCSRKMGGSQEKRNKKKEKGKEGDERKGKSRKGATTKEKLFITMEGVDCALLSCLGFLY